MMSESKKRRVEAVELRVYFSGVVTLSSTASTGLFFDSDIIETEELLSSSSAAVTKVETVTLNEFRNSYKMSHHSFICNATITDVMEEYGWYFISCTVCKWQVERSETSFICPNSKCKKPNTVGLIRYRFEVKVPDEGGNEGTFVIFDKKVLKLMVRQAPDVMNEMSEAGENGSGEESAIATPQCVLDIVGRTCKFQVKVNDFNLKSTRTTATVSRIIDADIQGPALVQPTIQTNDAIASAEENFAVDFSTVSQNEEKDGKRPRLN
ncbi:hypothetical protein Bca4012_036599 [Brassica carinata]